ncbi:MAG: bifunctional isocitrate dehydrogenase kinase/phosphatase, partial [Myxococcota bacterium]
MGGSLADFRLNSHVVLRRNSSDLLPPGERLAHALLEVFDLYRGEFKELTRQAKVWFETRAWLEHQKGTSDRLDLYAKWVQRGLAQARILLGASLKDEAVWRVAKGTFSRLIAYRNDEDLAETFFNSVGRANLLIVGVRPDLEFASFDNELLPSGEEMPIFRSFHRTHSTEAVVSEILTAYRFDAPYEDIERDARLAAQAIDMYVERSWTYGDFDVVELAEPIFYRNKGAYLVGRVRRASRILPFVLPLLHREEGICVDAVLLSETEVSVVFSFTRSYFFVNAERPCELIGFLRSILPAKPIHELYIALGFVKHGKTALYRNLNRHLRFAADRFVMAPGIKGMVMSVFTMPSYPVVFKLIKDAFDYPKQTSKAEVKNSYRLVFKHDRVGRLIDAQEFEYLSFDRDLFEPDCLDELLEVASENVQIQGDKVVVQHVYTERRLTPLNLYVEQVSSPKAEAAIIDYGNAIRELAAANIFPGDLLIKNFGVTRQGRVVFYDYDELCLLDDCNFRFLPPSYGDFDEGGGQSFYVGDNDIFPEELGNFLWSK